jgi:hypothetical protein
MFNYINGVPCARLLQTVSWWPKGIKMFTPPPQLDLLYVHSPKSSLWGTVMFSAFGCD